MFIVRPVWTQTTDCFSLDLWEYPLYRETAWLLETSAGHNQRDGAGLLSIRDLPGRSFGSKGWMSALLPAGKLPLNFWGRWPSVADCWRKWEAYDVRKLMKIK